MNYLIEVSDHAGANFRPVGFIDGYEEAVRYVNAKNQAGMSRGAFYRAVLIHVTDTELPWATGIDLHYRVGPTGENCGYCAEEWPCNVRKTYERELESK